MRKCIQAWSGGKDSAMALHTVLQSGEFDIVALLTTVTESYDRISMHGVRRELLEQQAASIGLPLRKVYIPVKSSNDEYERRMKEALDEFRKDGIDTVIFGDIFLEDLREYRENNLAEADMKGVFPIWKKDTSELAGKFIEVGFEAIVTCVDTETLDGSFSGRIINKQFISDLPADVDPCGENGEFHSFVFGGPIFKNKIPFKKGETVLRDNRFNFCDILPPDDN